MNENASPFDCLAAALHAKFGVLVRPKNLDRFKARLYVERKNDPDFACLSIHNSPDNPQTELFIVRKPDAPEKS